MQEKLCRETQRFHVGFNSINLEMPFMLGGGICIPDGSTAAGVVPRSPGYLPLGLLTHPALGKPPEHHPDLQPSPRSCPEIDKG